MSLGPRGRPARRDANDADLQKIARTMGLTIFTTLPTDWLAVVPRSAELDARINRLSRFAARLPWLSSGDCSEEVEDLQALLHEVSKTRLNLIEIKDGKKPKSARKLTQIEADALRIVGDSGAVIESVDDLVAFARRQ